MPSIFMSGHETWVLMAYYPPSPSCVIRHQRVVSSSCFTALEALLTGEPKQIQWPLSAMTSYYDNGENPPQCPGRVTIFLAQKL